MIKSFKLVGEFSGRFYTYLGCRRISHYCTARHSWSSAIARFAPHLVRLFYSRRMVSPTCAFGDADGHHLTILASFSARVEWFIQRIHLLTTVPKLCTIVLSAWQRPIVMQIC